jgi:hypothetical protein
LTQFDEQEIDSEEVVEPPRNMGRVWTIRLVVLVAVVLLVLPVFSTLQPRYYSRYRDLRISMAYWRNSTHGLMTCAGCHVEPGIEGYASFAARSIPAFYSQLVNGPAKTNILGAPSTAGCQKCHTDFRVVSPEGDLLVPHRAHVKILKIDCVECHVDLVHADNKEGVNRPKMTMCLEKCHDGKKASRECTACHTKKNAPDTHNAKNWLTVHEQQSKTGDCGTCHAWAPDFCNECHQQRPKSHSGNWKKDHQTRAKQSTKGCMFCHDEKFCKKCH